MSIIVDCKNFLDLTKLYNRKKAELGKQSLATVPSSTTSTSSATKTGSRSDVLQPVIKGQALTRLAKAKETFLKATDELDLKFRDRIKMGTFFLVFLFFLMMRSKD